MSHRSRGARILLLARRSRRRLSVLRIFLLLGVCLCLSLLSCHGNNDSEAPPRAIPAPSGSASASVVDTSNGIDLSKQSGTRYEVTYADNVVRVNADTVKKTLVGANRGHDIYVFTPTPELRSSRNSRQGRLV